MPRFVDRALLYIRTVAALRPSQTFGRLAYRLRKPKISPAPAPPLRPVRTAWTTGCPHPVSMLGPDTFVFLNVRRSLSGPTSWNAPDVEKLWLYNLHYFDDLNAIDAPARHSWHTGLIDRWIAENPVGEGNGWEPYPSSLRIVNWIKFSLRGGTLSASAVASLADQVRYLLQRLEHHILGNHLLANAKALVFAGCYFAGDEADRWFAKGLSILREQAAEQVLADGAHFELSPMYHAIILTDFLDTINLASCYGLRDHLPEFRVPKMLAWLAAMSHPDGDLSFFNDSAFGIAATHAQLQAYAVRLYLVDDPGFAQGSIHLGSSGYVRLENATAVLLLDAAEIGPSYLPGHAHADTLSFELSLAGQRVLVNGGTSRYGTGPERQLERSTRSHNTLVIDGENSSEVWAGFRVGRRARAKIDHVELADPAAQTVAAEHDGYRRLTGRNRHQRRWTLRENSLELLDQVSGPFQTAELFFHLHPEAQVSLTERGATISVGGKMEIELVVEGAILRQEADLWHPAFGVETAAQTLVATAVSDSISSRFSWATHS